MREHDSATVDKKEAQPTSDRGVLLAGLGVLAFSFSFPATAWALQGFGPWLSTGLRGLIAAVIAVFALKTFPAPLPPREFWRPLVIVALGCAIAFPLLTTLALQTSTTSHSAVIIGLLPLTTACISTWRTQTRQPVIFWIAAGLGAVAVLIFTVNQNKGRLDLADFYLLMALILCGAGYAEGGILSKSMPGWRVIAWGVVLALPVSIAVTAFGLTNDAVDPTLKSITGLAYVGAVSQFLGFVAWYSGMGRIGVPRASQIQLAQPLLTLAWAVLLMDEELPRSAVATSIVVLMCIIATQKVKHGANEK